MLERPFVNTETLQLADIHSLAIFYTPLDARFDRLTRLAQRALAVPVAAIALCHQDTLWFKSIQGWNMHELALADSFCQKTIASAELTIIADTRLDAIFRNHRLVTEAPHFRFYAGLPIRDRHDLVVGTLAIYDLLPRQPSASDVQALRDLGNLAQREFLTAELCDAQARIISKLSLTRRSAMIDGLTRVWNRGAAEELLTLALEQAEEEKTGLAVCMIDVDDFKVINDNHGHQAGDQVLRKVAATLVSNVRDGDAVCRYGGDEFLIIFQHSSQEEVEWIVQRIRERMTEFPFRTRTSQLTVSISAGLAWCAPDRPMSVERLIGMADRALYRAKQSNRLRHHKSTTSDA